jgi:predicted nucleic acid-binding protein
VILVDTSIWAEFFRKNSRVTIPKEMISNLAICPPVLQEVLQGIKEDAVYERIKIALLNFKILGAEMPIQYHLAAAEIYRSCRRRGVTIRSSADFLIAAIALQEKAQVWHQGRDFEKIAKFTELKLFNV